MAKTIEELVKNRKSFLESMRLNNIEDGIRSLLTDLYPDNAHFIFELLQNAEDMNATEVQFRLYSDHLEFDHNGTKRDFNIDDIDAITSIGNNVQKKNDPTSIGKFGVGFKAVFAYTSSPEIHSGNYHFRITDYFVPDFVGVEHVSVFDKHGVKWTKFSFPFNHPKKTAKKAVEEISRSLATLDPSSILFLRSIKKIDYLLPDGNISYLERYDRKNNYTDIVFKPLNEAEQISNWLKFSDDVDFEDGYGNSKKLSLSVAYSLLKEKGKKYKVVPIKGKVFIYFPCEKESSDLRFHINAPFASTVARDSVRDCEDNYLLIDKVASLVKDSIQSIKELGLLDIDFLEVLPCKGETSAFYEVIFEEVADLFQSNSLLPTLHNDEFVKAGEAVYGDNSYRALFSDEDLKCIGLPNHKWISNVKKNSIADKFLKCLSVYELNTNEFVTLCNDTNNFQIEKLCKKNIKDSDWLIDLYDALRKAYENISYSKEVQFVQSIRKYKIYQSSENTNFAFYDAYHIYMLEEGNVSEKSPVPILNSDLFNREDSDNSYMYYTGTLEYFFSNVLEIPKFDELAQIRMLLEKYNGVGFSIDDEYYQVILDFASYVERNKNAYDDYQDMLDWKIYVGEKNEKLFVCGASQIVLGEKYNSYYSSLVYEAYENKAYLFYDGYAEVYDDEELEVVVKLLKKCGAISTLKIEECAYYLHPEYRKKLYSYAKRTDYSESMDYTIEGIKDLVDDPKIETSKLIWETLIYHKDRKYSMAYNYPNASTGHRSCESSLFYYLLSRRWIPSKDGKFYAPADIHVNDLHEEFKYDGSIPLIQELKIGSKLTEKQKKFEELNQHASELGCVLVSQKDYEEFEEFKRRQNQEIAHTESFDFERETHNLDRTQKGSSRGGSSRGSLKIRDIEETIADENSITKEERAMCAKIVSSTKEEKAALMSWYDGECQICGTVIEGADGKNHFSSINIFAAKQLPQRMMDSISTGWNSLCLCPNCALKYKVCSKRMGKFFEAIDYTRGSDYQHVDLPIELNGEEEIVSFHAQHFASLKKVITYLKEK